MTSPAERLGRVSGLVVQAEKYRLRMGSESGEARALTETLHAAALHEICDELIALRREGVLTLLQSFLETWEAGEGKA